MRGEHQRITSDSNAYKGAEDSETQQAEHCEWFVRWRAMTNMIRSGIPQCLACSKRQSSCTTGLHYYSCIWHCQQLMLLGSEAVYSSIDTQFREAAKKSLEPSAKILDLSSMSRKATTKATKPRATELFAKCARRGETRAGFCGASDAWGYVLRCVGLAMTAGE